jgi:hypothetical protein
VEPWELDELEEPEPDSLEEEELGFESDVVVDEPEVEPLESGAEDVPDPVLAEPAAEPAAARLSARLSVR